MKIISMVNNKGGVGKTTSTVNLASALTKLNKKVLMIDLDSQASLSVYCNVEQNNIEFSIYNVMMDECEIEKAIITTDLGIDLIPATIELSVAEMRLISKIGREYVLKNKLDDLKIKYDYVLIDNSPSMSIITVNSLTASKYLIAPVEPEYLSLKGLEVLMQSVSEIKKSVNKNLTFMGVIITMYNSVTLHHQEVVEVIKERYPIFNHFIKRSIKFSDASLANQSIIDFAGERFDGSNAYLEIAREVISYE
jgi:chromosome partitioning protein